MKIICTVCKSVGEIPDEIAQDADLTTAVCEDCVVQFQSNARLIAEAASAPLEGCECNACKLLGAVKKLPDHGDLFVRDWADA